MPQSPNGRTPWYGQHILSHMKKLLVAKPEGLCLELCQRVQDMPTEQSNHTTTKPPLFPITPKKDVRPFSMINMDWITKFLVLDGWDSILTITNHDCSKAVLFIPCKKTMGTGELAKEYFQKVFPHFSIPDKIISDRDPCLTSELAKAICKEGDIQQNISTMYHPQTDGQSEQTN